MSETNNTSTMNNSPTFSLLSASPPGLSWLLSSSQNPPQGLAPTAEDGDYSEHSPSQASLISQTSSYTPSSNYIQSSSYNSRKQYSSMSRSPSLVRMTRSNSMLRSANSSTLLKPSTSSNLLKPSSLPKTSSMVIPPELTFQQQVSPPETVQQPPEMDILLQSILVSTTDIFGLYALEVWKFEKESGSLICAPIVPPSALDLKQHSSGLFIRRIPQEADFNSPSYNPTARDAYERLTDTTRLDYVVQGTTDPGVGIAGAMWSESNYKSLSANTLAAVTTGVQTLSSTFFSSSSQNRSNRSYRASKPAAYYEDDSPSSIRWRDIKDLAEDPDQPYDQRLHLFARAGFGLAAGIPFNVRDVKGIVIFFVNPHADLKKLSSKTNSRMIEFATQFIGSAAATQIPLKRAKAVQGRRSTSNWRMLRAKILAVIRFQRPMLVKNRGRSRSWGSPTMRRSGSLKLLRQAASTAMINREESFKILSEATMQMKDDVIKGVGEIHHHSKARTLKWWTKVQGGHASTPPSFDNIQTAWTFVGVYTTHVILSNIGYLLAKRSYRMIIGPLGALTTLQYNLTAAPAR